ncbi:hypothetical protein MMC06_005265 [Schaereria dolodes]|nr:hypothetical protein [Schaereria dolodes]
MPHYQGGSAKRPRYASDSDGEPRHQRKPFDARQRKYTHPNTNTPYQYHYYNKGTWQHPATLRESRYSDFVPCTYDERTLITRLYKYARTFLSQTNNSSGLQRKIIGSACHLDIEMIASSPSPTLQSSTASPSCRPAFLPRTNNGSYRYSASNSAHTFIKPPSPAALPRHAAQSPASFPASQKRRYSPPTSSTHSPSKQTIDVGTQYSPPTLPLTLYREPVKGRGKRRDRSGSPEAAPPEPSLVPQMPAKRSVPPTSPQPATASSTTLANSATAASPSSSQGSSPKRARLPNPAVKFMPARYESCDVKDLVVLISNMLMELIRFNDEIPLRDGKLTRFHSRAPPGISVMDYLQRLTTHATLSPPILLSMVYYIDRLCALYPAFTISSLTVHRFLITSATVASKGLSDSFWTNNTYARVGGVSLKELALLELEFLWRVEWKIVPKPEVLVDYYRSLVERSEGFEVEPEVKIEEKDDIKQETSVDPQALFGHND